MRRQRNKVARLSRDHRSIAIEGLLDGWTYDDIRDELRDAGVSFDDMPSDSSFTAYRRGPEFAAAQAGWQDLRQRAQARSAMATALAEGGIEEAAQLVTFEALEQMREAMLSGRADPAEFGRLSVAVIRETRKQALAERDAQIAALKAELQQVRDGGDKAPALDPAKVMDELDRILGVKG